MNATPLRRTMAAAAAITCLGTGVGALTGIGMPLAGAATPPKPAVAGTQLLAALLGVTITSPVADATAVIATPTITGTAVAGATVTLTDAAGAQVCVTVAAGDGTFSCTPTSPLPAGLIVLTATASDPGNVLPAGTVLPAPTTVTFTVGAVVPPGGTAAPVVFTSPLNGALGVVPNAPITGTAPANTTVTVTGPGGVQVCLAVATAAGTFSCTPSTPLPPGAVTLTATVTDPAGVLPPGTVLPAATSVTVTVAAPLPPGGGISTPVVFTSPLDGALGVVADAPITGTAPAGATVTVTGPGGVQVCVVVVAADSTFSCTPAGGLPAGTIALTATVTDPTGALPAGTTLPGPATVTVTVGPGAPTGPPTTPPTGGGTTPTTGGGTTPTTPPTGGGTTGSGDGGATPAPAGGGTSGTPATPSGGTGFPSSTGGFTPSGGTGFPSSTGGYVPSASTSSLPGGSGGSTTGSSSGVSPSRSVNTGLGADAPGSSPINSTTFGGVFLVLAGAGIGVAGLRRRTVTD